MSDFIEVDIRKPLYVYEGVPFCNIRDKYLKKAKYQGKLLKITTPTTTHYTTPEAWIKTGKKLKEVFLFEKHPMTLWGNFAVDNNPPVEHEINMGNYLDNMHKLSEIFRTKILRKRVNI
jgi:hypothetical protein